MPIEVMRMCKDGRKRPTGARERPIDIKIYRKGEEALKRKIISMLFALVLMLSFSMVTAVPVGADGPVTRNYGDFTLPPGGGTFWLPDVWDLNRCDATISYTLDLSGAPNVAYTGNYGQAANVGLLSFATPTAGARMSGYLADGDNAGVEFPTFPDKPNTQDLDDKFNMQRFPNPGSWSETMYDVYCTTDTIAASPFGSWSNYGIWFDRDGVDPWQDADPSTPPPGGSGVPWGSVEGGTYNTGGIYDVQLTFHKNSPTKGTACPLMFPGLANPVAPGGYGIPTGFNQSSPGPGYDDFPAGISFDTDVTRMGTMQVVVQGASGNGTIVVKDLTVTGCLATPEGLKNHAKAELDSIYPTEDKKVDKGLEKAIKHLDKSMDEDLWEGDAYLEAKHGKKVFDEEKKVVKELKKLIDKKGTSQAVKDECKLIIKKLCLADGILAHTAYEEAQEYAGDPKADKELEKCQKELEKAGEDLDKGRCDKGIDHFKKAWKHAQKAMGNSPEPDGEEPE